LLSIRHYNDTDKTAWDNYVERHPDGTLYHLTAWKEIIERTYHHKSYYLIASIDHQDPGSPIVGILPLVHLKHFLFGNHLISIPFFDMAGILADNAEVEQALLSEAIHLGRKLKVDTIELRQTTPLGWLSELSGSPQPMVSANPDRRTALNARIPTVNCHTKSHKVRMLLALPDSSIVLMKSFKSKFRNKINKTLKAGLNVKIGALELLDDFYNVFSFNMRDLGSPVHSKKLIRSVLEAFPGKARLVAIYNNNNPIAGGMFVCFKNTLQNPWASAIKQYSSLRPNTLAYWNMLSYACDNGFKYFDFGRSTPDEGTYKFKEQWGATPVPLHWYFVSLNGQSTAEDTTDKSKFDTAIHYWQKLPVQVTKIMGPMIRKHIGL
jgi:FemAB-related protein (PEP-CTERM system-associated)